VVALGKQFAPRRTTITIVELIIDKSLLAEFSPVAPSLIWSSLLHHRNSYLVRKSTVSVRGRISKPGMEIFRKAGCDTARLPLDQFIATLF